MEAIASQIIDDSIKELTIQNHKYFLSNDTTNNFTFIIKTKEKLKSKKVFPIILKLKELIREKYSDKERLSMNEKLKILDSLKEEINKILGLGNNLKNFLE